MTDVPTVSIVALEARLKVAAFLFYVVAAVLIGISLVAFEHLIEFLERHVSDDGSLKGSTRLMVEVKLYAYACASTGIGVFLNACTRQSFRDLVCSFLIYDPGSPGTPNPAAVLRSLIVIVSALLLISLLGQYMRYVFDLGDTSLGLLVYTYFNLDQEHWVPTTFSSAILLYSGMLLANVARRTSLQGEEFVVHWVLLSLAFVYLAIDEKFRVHERAFNFLKPFIDVDVPVFWVVPAGTLTLIGVLAYLRFVFHLSLAHRLLFVFAGSMYLGGAIGWEVVGRAYGFDHGLDTLRYELIANVEEIFEMIGIVIFIYALQSYLQQMVRPAAN